MRRREYLAAVGAAATVAGCSASGGSDGDENADEETTEEETRTGPADFVDVGLTGPASATVGQTVQLTVSARNRGGTTGTYTDTVLATEGTGDLEAPVEVTDVEPGQTGETTLETEIELGGRYVFELADADARHVVQTSPEEAAVGEPLELGGDLRATLSAVEVPRTVLYTTDESVGFQSVPASKTFEAPTGAELVVVHLAVENTGTERVTVDPSAVRLADGEFYAGFPDDAPLSSGAIDGRAMHEDSAPTVDPSQVVDVWQLAQVPREALREGTRLQVQRDATDTPPEAAWTIPSQSDRLDDPPAFELASVDAPSSASRGESYEIDFTVRNAGGTAGTFRGALQFYSENEGRWFDLITAERVHVSAELGPGEERRWTVTNESQSTGTFRYRVTPTDRTWTTTFD